VLAKGAGEQDSRHKFLLWSKFEPAPSRLTLTTAHRTTQLLKIMKGSLFRTRTSWFMIF